MNFIRKDNRGFASFEFVWTIPVFALLFVVFSDFFHLFNSSARTMIDLHYSTFSRVGQVNKTPKAGYGKNSTGLIYEGEPTLVAKGKACTAGVKCDTAGEQYVLTGRSRNFLLFGGGHWEPTLQLNLDLPPFK